MECDEERLLTGWMIAWNDLVEFEIVPRVTSTEAAAT